MDWATLVQHYGLVVLFVGAVLEGETILLLAGYMAHQGLLSLPATILTAFAGACGGDQGIAYLGRHYGGRLIAAKPHLARQAERARQLLAAWGPVFLVFLRFLYGLRTVSLLIVGASQFPARRFLILDGIGAALWATCFTLVGYYFGMAIEARLGRSHSIQEAVLLAALAAGAMAGIGALLRWTWRWARRR